MNYDLIGTIVGQIFVAGAIYGAIRSDLRNIHERLRDLREAVTHAHARIDSQMLRRAEDHHAN